MNKTHTSLSAEAITALEQGRKIEAIKIYREAAGVGLKEAKEAIEKYLAKNPAVNDQFKQNASSGTGKNMVIVLLIAIIVYLLLKAKF
jgi:ribosomal protein L7/L12